MVMPAMWEPEIKKIEVPGHQGKGRSSQDPISKEKRWV
jgi:hypothetical protein